MVQLNTFEEMRHWAHTHSDDNHIRLDQLAAVKRDSLHVVATIEAVDD
jgi:hypothetical protein